MGSEADHTTFLSERGIRNIFIFYDWEYYKTTMTKCRLPIIESTISLIDLLWTRTEVINIIKFVYGLHVHINMYENKYTEKWTNKIFLHYINIISSLIQSILVVPLILAKTCCLLLANSQLLFLLVLVEMEDSSSSDSWDDEDQVNIILNWFNWWLIVWDGWILILCM